MVKIRSGGLATIMWIAGAMLSTAEPDPAPTPREIDLGVAVMRPVSRTKVRGTIRLVPTEKGLRLVGRVNNLTPGDHLMNLHEFGDLRSNDASSAGQLQTLGDSASLGELGRITAGDNGVAAVDVVVPEVDLPSWVGRSIVLYSRPRGGQPVSIGVVGIGNPHWRWPAQN